MTIIFTVPNTLTYIRILLTPVFLFALFQDGPFFAWMSLIIFLVSSFTDWIDGYLARRFNLVSNLGKILDPIADKILTSAAFIGFWILGLMDGWMALVIILRDIVLTLYRLYQDSKNRVIPANVISKWKTGSQYAVIILVLFLSEMTQTHIFNPQMNQQLQSILYGQGVYLLLFAVTIYTLLSGLIYFVEDFFLNKNVKNTNTSN